MNFLVFIPVFSQAKKKKLLAVNSIQQPCKRLMIYSRDFKIHSYGFKMVGNNEKIIQFLKQMSQYAFPDKNNLFVLNYNLKVKADEFSAEPPMPMFIRQKDWQDELTRIDQHPNWYVTSANENFQLSSSLPEYFIIPESLNNESLTEMAMAFDDQRLLIDQGDLGMSSADYFTSKEHEDKLNAYKKFAENVAITLGATSFEEIQIANVMQLMY
ncbi:Hypothetical predicted protein [Octopus vulgaris]|uniref:Myotubularin phosphatase domain-containing protein n=1 Tax=Octopus vulgaris TaxID=6645 RepID=A0AA36FDD3_OCTVU|nr:Hypothetical predicted protein [Octopus vulgaris]